MSSKPNFADTPTRYFVGFNVLWHKMKYEWMAFKSRDAKNLEADVDEVVAGFGKKYKLDFC